MMRGVVIAGAGPAGCAAAIALRRLGVPVMLVDRARFPRPKICGGCLGPATIDGLRALGVDPASIDGALGLRRLQLHANGAAAEVGLADSLVVSREHLDLRLVRAAETAGAELVTGTRVTLGAIGPGGREVILRGDISDRLPAALVILATGLPIAAAVSVRRRGARIGLAQSRQSVSGPPAGTVTMAASRDGYVGSVRFADGRLNVAASVSAAALHAAGSPAAVIDGILTASGQPRLHWNDGWGGTPALRHTRAVDPGAHVLRVGDAAGFWEPFTGEGIGWALRGGRTIATTAAQLAERWDERVARRLRQGQQAWLARSQRRSWLVAAVAARPRIAAATMALLQRAPGAAGWLLPGRQAARAPS